MAKVYASLGKEELLRGFLSKTTFLSSADLSLIEALLRKAEGSVGKIYNDTVIKLDVKGFKTNYSNAEGHLSTIL